MFPLVNGLVSLQKSDAWIAYQLLLLVSGDGHFVDNEMKCPSVGTENREQTRSIKHWVAGIGVEDPLTWHGWLYCVMVAKYNWAGISTHLKGNSGILCVSAKVAKPRGHQARYTKYNPAHKMKGITYKITAHECINVPEPFAVITHYASLSTVGKYSAANDRIRRAKWLYRLERMGFLFFIYFLFCFVFCWFGGRVSVCAKRGIQHQGAEKPFSSFPQSPN